MHSILSDIAEDIKNGKVFESNKKIRGILSGEYEVIFMPVVAPNLSEYAGIAMDLGNNLFKAIIK